MVDKPFQFDIIGMHEKHSRKAMQAVTSGMNLGMNLSPFQSDEHLTVSGFQDQLDILLTQISAQSIMPDTMIMHPSIWSDMLALGTLTIIPSDNQITVQGTYMLPTPVDYISVTVDLSTDPPREFEPVDPTEHFDID
jgi:hypothetical protein